MFCAAPTCATAFQDASVQPASVKCLLQNRSFLGAAALMMMMMISMADNFLDKITTRKFTMHCQPSDPHATGSLMAIVNSVPRSLNPAVIAEEFFRRPGILDSRWTPKRYKVLKKCLSLVLGLMSPSEEPKMQEPTPALAVASEPIEVEVSTFLFRCWLRLINNNAMQT